MSEEARIIGAPSDYGANRRGVDMGPSAIRYAGLQEQLEAAGVACVDVGDVTAPPAETQDADKRVPEQGRAKFVEEVEAVSHQVADEVAAAIGDGATPLVIGGDHSVAIGSLRGAAADADVGTVWFDAHADMNTPSTSPSGNVHGMPLAAALGNDEFEGVEWATAPRLDPENVVWVGLRSVDDREAEAVRESAGTAFTMSDIDEHGIDEVVDRAMSIASDGVDGVHVSLDLDWLDPNEAPGVGTPVRGGVTYREAHHALELVAEHDGEHDSLRSMEVVEVNPILDEHNETAELATELAASALGKRILGRR
ncbi:arginase [Halorubellus sp. JP-L1]|uniref:arginase n=1 Tax=Halorubellus sp. JP-L1 TaxID=2715753 RepID=UPI00140CE6CC|nr:arginase [Halorubellus sp. JP-L1]NHN40756.1 arginase [Halorubellus sp. JP-L1]